MDHENLTCTLASSFVYNKYVIISDGWVYEQFFKISIPKAHME